MKLTYETKYDAGDTVYQILSYMKEPSVRAREIVRVIGAVQGKGGSVIKYELAPLSKNSITSFMNEVVEGALYPSLEDAEAAAKVKFQDYVKRMCEQYEKELKDIEVRKRDETERAIASIEEDYADEAEFATDQLKKFKKLK